MIDVEEAVCQFVYNIFVVCIGVVAVSVFLVAASWFVIQLWSLVLA